MSEAILDILRHSSVGLAIVELSGTFRFVNEGYAKLHGCQPADLIGQDFHDLDFDHERYSAIHDEFVAGTREEFKDDVLFGGDRWFSFECSLMRDDVGRPESVVVVAHDVTKRKIAERRAAMTAARLDAIHESDAIGMHYFTASGKIAEPNEALLAMSGLSAEDAKDLDLCDLTPSEWREQDDVMFKRLYETRRPIAFLKEMVSRKTGKTIPVSVTATLSRMTRSTTA